jgi:hypothetical protein
VQGSEFPIPVSPKKKKRRGEKSTERVLEKGRFRSRHHRSDHSETEEREKDTELLISFDMVRNSLWAFIHKTSFSLLEVRGCNFYKDWEE